MKVFIDTNIILEYFKMSGTCPLSCGVPLLGHPCHGLQALDKAAAYTR